MKTLLVVILVAACSAAKLSPNQRAPLDASSSGGGEYLTVTVPSEHLSDEELEISSNQRFGKKLNSTSANQSSPSYTTQYPYNQPYTTPFSKQYFSPVTESHNSYINGQSNQQYLPPIEEKNSFNVIPQETQSLNHQYLPPINNRNNSQFYSHATNQPPTTNYLSSSQFRYNPSVKYYSNQYESQYQQPNNIQRNVETYSQQQNSYENPQSSQQTVTSFDNQTPQQQNSYENPQSFQQTRTSFDNQTPQQYSSQPSSNNLENQYVDSSNLIPDQHFSKTYSQFQPINPQELSQPTESEYNRTPKEHIPSSRSDFYSMDESYNGLPSSSASRRYDISTPPSFMQYNYQQNAISAPSPYSLNYLNRENFTNYNQYQEKNVYQTTSQPVVEIGQATNFPKWLNYSPSFVSRHESSESTVTPPVQQAQSRQAMAYGEKIHQQPAQHQTYFAASRSSNIGSPIVSTSNTTQAPEKYAESQTVDRPRFVPQTPSQFKPSPQPIIRNDLISNPYIQPQQQQSYAKTYQYPIPYQHGPTTEPMPILKQMNEMDINGNYIYETLTGDQTHIMQQGHIENKGTDHEEQVMQGSYSFVGDDGKTYTVTYIADSNGFRATGEHLPTAPPIPEVIQRSIELNLAEEAAEAAQASQTPQRYQYPQPDSNNRYPVVEQAGERGSIPHIPNYDNGYKY